MMRIYREADSFLEIPLKNEWEHHNHFIFTAFLNCRPVLVYSEVGLVPSLVSRLGIRNLNCIDCCKLDKWLSSFAYLPQQH